MKKFLVSAATVAALTAGLGAAPSEAAPPGGSGASVPTATQVAGAATSTVGGVAKYVIKIVTGSRPSDSRSSNAAGRLKVVAKLVKNGRLRQKIVTYRRVDVGRSYTVKVGPLRHRGKYTVAFIFKPDADTTYQRSRLTKTVRVS